MRSRPLKLKVLVTGFLTGFGPGCGFHDQCGILFFFAVVSRVPSTGFLLFPSQTRRGSLSMHLDLQVRVLVLVFVIFARVVEVLLIAVFFY